MTRWIALIAPLLVLELALGPAGALAQSAPTGATTPSAGGATTQSTTGAAPESSTAGAFDRLSPGNQKIARALFDAQTRDGGTGTLSSASRPQRLTLDEIAALRQGGRQGWGQVFRDLQTRGLVQEKNLGQVVSRYQQRHGGVVSTASGRTYPSGGGEGRGASAVDGGGTGTDVSSGRGNGQGSAGGYEMRSGQGHGKYGAMGVRSGGTSGHGGSSSGHGGGYGSGHGGGKGK